MVQWYDDTSFDVVGQSAMVTDSGTWAVVWRNTTAPPWRWRIAVLALLALAAVSGCTGAPPRGFGPSDANAAPGPRAAQPGSTAAVEPLRVQVLSARPHDPGAYTQGLLLYDGYLYESTGLEGRSSLRQVDPQTGEVLRRVDVDPRIFGEGLARVGDRLIQITWQNHVAFVYDLPSFERVGEFAYEGEGWGLCYDGERLVMSDGSNTLTFRNPDTFEVLGRVAVTDQGRPLDRLNELECVGDDVYANVWFTDTIVRINKQTGQVTAEVDARGLLPPDEKPVSSDGVLNGIAYDAENGMFLITGKLWPKLFEVWFVPY